MNGFLAAADRISGSGSGLVFHGNSEKKERTGDVKKRVSLADLVKVGPEGYIHGYICVRPPCGPKHAEAFHDTKTGKVQGAGRLVGRQLKKEPSDAGYSIAHVGESGEKTRLGGHYATRDEAAKAVALYHNVKTLHEHAAGKSSPAQAHLSAAEAYLRSGHHVGAAESLTAARDAADRAGDASLSKYTEDARAALSDRPHPLNAPSVSPEKEVPSSAASKPAAADLGNGYSATHRDLDTSNVGKGIVHEFTIRGADGKVAANALAYDRGDHVFLDQLSAVPSEQGKGLGSKVLNHVISSFPGRDIRLKPEPYGDKIMSEPQLREFYRKRGFKDNAGGEMTRPAEVSQPEGAPAGTASQVPASVVKPELPSQASPSSKKSVAPVQVPGSEVVSK